MTDQFVPQDENSVLVPKALIRQVRQFIQDYAEVNEVFDGEETADHQIARYLVDEVQEWNGTPPIIRGAMINPITLMASPDAGAIRAWIVKITGAKVLQSVIIKMARNDIPYTAGNVTIQPNAAWRNLQTIVQDIQAQYRDFRDRYKISINSESAYGANHSELYTGLYDARDGYLVVQF